MNTTANPLPHPNELTDTQALLEVHYYEEGLDEFACTMHTVASWQGEGHRFCIPAMILSMLTHEYGEPSEFINRTFLIERGAKKQDYARVHGALTIVGEQIDQTRFGQARIITPEQATIVHNALNDSAHPLTL